MAKPFFRYLPARLKPLGAPAVWVPLTIFALLSIFIWEYYRNPDWFERDPITNANPQSDLTPEEQARLSEIDTVDLLLEGARVPNNPSEADDDSPLNSVDLDAEAAEINRRLANRDNPFGEYEAEYAFPGANRPGNAEGAETPDVRSATPGLATPSPTPRTTTGTFNFDSTPDAPLPTTSSALSDAIDRQQAIRAAESSDSQSGDIPASTGDLPDDLSIPSSDTQGTSRPRPSSSAPGSVPVPFIRTTPDMSPPVGTTGYQAPATSDLPAFNRRIPSTTRNPLNVPAPSSSGQIGTVQPPPIARPVQRGQVEPSETIYTAPRSTQPEQNRRAR